MEGQVINMDEGNRHLIIQVKNDGREEWQITLDRIIIFDKEFNSEVGIHIRPKISEIDIDEDDCVLGKSQADIWQKQNPKPKPKHKSTPEENMERVTKLREDIKLHMENSCGGLSCNTCPITGICRAIVKWSKLGYNNEVELATIQSNC